MPPLDAPPTAVRVIVDADACVPPERRATLAIAVAPAEPELLLERVPVPRLALERGPFAVEDVARSCEALAEPGGAVLYVRTGDGDGSPEGSAEAARAAVEGRGARFAVVETGATLMGAGWAAVVAAEAVRAGASLEEAAEAARAAAGRTAVLAMLEHPEVAGAIEPSVYVSPPRMIATLEGDRIESLGTLPRREDALALLRDRFGRRIREEGGRPRVAIHHAAAAAAAEAMARWTERHLQVGEVVVAPLTRHQAARLGVGLLAMAWLRAE